MGGKVASGSGNLRRALTMNKGNSKIEELGQEISLISAPFANGESQ
jgi:hypothetical protein